MPRLITASPDRTRTRKVIAGIVLLLVLLLVLRLLLVPDPAGALLFARAQRLEEAGLIRPAIRQYELLAVTHPQSPFAPRALQREAVIYTELAREGETQNFALAIDTYNRLANTYPQSSIAGEALLAVGAISLADLNNEEQARAAYQQALQKYGSNRELASESTLRIGRTYESARDGKNAQAWFQQVLQKYTDFSERCAEAQFALAETQETLLKNREAARTAYEATVSRYPKTVWAGKAKERLGMLLYSEGAPRARRVLIEVAPITGETTSNALFDALRPVFAARGLNVGSPVIRGWSLEPFFAGFDSANPGRVPSAPFTPWQTAAVNAGLRYSISDGGQPKDALAGLQGELDEAHLVLTFDGTWRMVSGYDAARDFVYLLDSGARLTKVPAGDFVKRWNRRSTVGGSYSLVSFEAPGEDSRAKPRTANNMANGNNAAAQPSAGTAGASKADEARSLTYAQLLAQRTPLSTPTFIYTLKPLPEKEAHRRALRSAAEWMRRGQSNGVLINLEALRSLANEFRRAAGESTSQEAEATPTAPAEALARDENNDLTETDPNATASATPGTDGADVTATPTATPGSSPARPVTLSRVRSLLAWRNGPLRNWIESRRAAAAYLDIAAARLNNGGLRNAANAMRESVSALEEVSKLLPAPDSIAVGDGALNDSARRALEAAADKIEAARAAEDRATGLMEEAVR